MTVKGLTPFKGKIPWLSTGPLDYWNNYSTGETHRDWSKTEKEGYIKNGNHDSWTRTWVEPYDFRDNTPFKAKLTMSGYYRGRSAAGYSFKDDKGQEYTMRLRCLEDLLMRSRIVKGVTEGWFAFVKQGSNYSLVLVSCDEPS